MSDIESTRTNEHHNYGLLWPDGTFQSMGRYSTERGARQEFEVKLLDHKNVPASLRPVFATQRVITTVETYPAEELAS